MQRKMSVLAIFLLINEKNGRCYRAKAINMQNYSYGRKKKVK